MYYSKTISGDHLVMSQWCLHNRFYPVFLQRSLILLLKSQHLSCSLAPYKLQMLKKMQQMLLQRKPTLMKIQTPKVHP